MKKRVFSLLLCLIMALSLVPMTAFAASYKAGDISGTTGAGTQSDPVICDTYAELKAALQSSEDLYITVNSFRSEGAASYKMLSCDTDYANGNFAISVPSGTEKHLTINTLVDLRAVSINDDEMLYSLISNNGTLYVSGTGKLNGGFNAYYMNAVIFNQPGATLDISGDISITTNSNVNAHGRAIYNKGRMAIHSGTFVGDNGTKQSDNLCQAVLNESAYASSISGGTFWCNRAFSTQEGYGLSINDEGGSLTISAGIFREGIKVGTGHTVDEYIAEGSKYETSGDGTVTVSAATTGNAINSVTITGLDEPVVGQHPDFAYSIANANDLGIMGSIRWVKYVNGLGKNMTADDVFEAGSKYGCYISINAIGDSYFRYTTEQDDYGDEYNVFYGTFTINGASQEAYVSVGAKELSATWWVKEAKSAVMLGDVDGNGKVNMVDVTKLRQYLTNKTKYPLAVEAAADVDNNGKINMVDVTKIRQYLTNKDKYPLG